MRRSIILWLFICGACLYEAEAVLETFFIEDLCAYKDSSIIDLSRAPTGILSPLLPKTHSIDCTIRLQPLPFHSVVLSIYNYNIDDDSELTIEDSDRFKIALVGVGRFEDEKKSIISEGRVFIRYRSNVHMTTVDAPSRNETAEAPTSPIFQITFTQVGNAPCLSSDFKCKNGKCLPKEYVCSGHNRCGDNSDTKNCVVKDPKSEKRYDFQPKETSNTIGIWIALIVVGGIGLIILIIFYIIVLIRYPKKKANPSPNGNGTSNGANNASLQSVSSTVPQNQPPPPSNASPVAPVPVSSEEAPRASVYERVRRSLRRPTTPRANEPVQLQRTENYQVPSMYPSLDPEPTAPYIYGADNPEFKIEE